MLEVVFDHSIAGSLKVAKGRRPGQRSRGTVAAVYQGTADGGKAPASATVERVWQGAELPGTAADVAPLVLALDIGDLSDLDTGRRTFLPTLYGPVRAEEKSRFDACMEKYWQANLETLTRLETARQTGEEVRVWVADWCPGDLCGLYHVCDLLRNADLPVSLVRAPRERVRSDGTLITYRGIGEFGPEELGELAASAAPLTLAQRRAYANRWRELVAENAPLRAVVNGRLMSVGEDHYDFALRAALPEREPVKIAHLLGDTICALNGVGDGWLYTRVLAMLADGGLVETAPGDPERPYSAMAAKI